MDQIDQFDDAMPAPEVEAKASKAVLDRSDPKTLLP
jgi:hypothetical protein